MKEHVALVKRACRVCNNTENAEILLATRYNHKGELLQDLKPYDGKIIGFLEDGMCKECKERYKDYYVFIVCDLGKTTDENNPYRTGEIVQILKTSEYGRTLEDKTKNGIAYIDIEQYEQFKTLCK